jgi:hypothetical protein
MVSGTLSRKGETMKTKFFHLAVAGLLLWSPIQAAQDQPPGNEPATEEEIRSLIKALADIEDPDVGFSPTTTGEIFAPVPSSYQYHNGIFMDHGLRRSAALARLVEIGPQSLPLLLEALDDDTPTQVTVEHSGHFGGMWYADTPLKRLVVSKSNEFPDNLVAPTPYAWLNPTNPREKELFDKAKNGKRAGAKDVLDNYSAGIHKHTMTIGDICYVIIGQITNRPYLAAQYQMTACVYINSPIHDKNLASDVRGIWDTDDCRKMLLDSLLIDFNSTDFRNGAALRLAFYFPHESENLFLDFLKDVEIDESPADGESPESSRIRRLEAKNTFEIVEAMSWSKSHKVRTLLAEIMKTTESLPLFVATLAAIGEDDEPVLFARCDEFLTTSSNRSRLLLHKMANRFGDRAKDSYVRFLSHATLEGKAALCRVLTYDAQRLAPEVLAPLLDDITDVKGYGRICDLAAEAIAKSETHLVFDTNASQEKRDQQIEKIRQHCTDIGVRRTGSVKTKDE